MNPSAFLIPKPDFQHGFAGQVFYASLLTLSTPQPHAALGHSCYFRTSLTFFFDLSTCLSRFAEVSLSRWKFCAYVQPSKSPVTLVDLDFPQCSFFVNWRFSCDFFSLFNFTTQVFPVVSIALGCPQHPPFVTHSRGWFYRPFRFSSFL